MENKTSRIVVFDSGLGGISVLRELKRLMPRENYLYFGDSALAPYGTRSTQQVRQLTLQRIENLVTPDTKAVVIACNTATSAAIDVLRQKYPGRVIIGVEPALKLAAERFPGGRILVMATNVTLREQKFSRLMARFSSSHEIMKVPCPGVVELVERGKLQDKEMLCLLRRCLGPYLHQPVDAIVLGCTHYPFARKAIAQVAGPNVAILDGGEGTARETKRRLQQMGLLNATGQGVVEFHNSLPGAEILGLSRRLLEQEI